MFIPSPNSGSKACTARLDRSSREVAGRLLYVSRRKGSPVPLLTMHQDNQEGSQFFSSMQRDALAPLILKVALLDTSAASKAVQQALLALSCLHLRRDAMAAIYKTRAISWLSRSLTPATESRVAFQNAAASMLLCTFEVCC